MTLVAPRWPVSSVDTSARPAQYLTALTAATPSCASTTAREIHRCDDGQHHHDLSIASQIELISHDAPRG
jgi:hypothetical protein